MAGATVRVDGMRALVRDLRAMDPIASRLLLQELKRMGKTVATDARRLAPRGSRPIPATRKPRKRIADSITAQVRYGSVVVRSPLPYSNWLHWGGAIHPRRSQTIRHARTEFIYRPALARREQTLRRTGAAIERAARRQGWH